jgi:hypothetical protein
MTDFQNRVRQNISAAGPEGVIRSSTPVLRKLEEDGYITSHAIPGNLDSLRFVACRRGR